MLARMPAAEIGPPKAESSFQDGDASLMAAPTKAGRAVLPVRQSLGDGAGPPSAIGSETNPTPPSSGGQGTARPATQNGPFSQNVPATAPPEKAGLDAAPPHSQSALNPQSLPAIASATAGAIRGSTARLSSPKSELAEVNPQLDASSQNSPSAPARVPSGAEIAGARDLAPPLAPLDPPSGTPVAINGQRMKSASQRNEIAGSAAQKLPPAPRRLLPQPWPMRPPRGQRPASPTISPIPSLPPRNGWALTLRPKASRPQR